MAQAPATVLDFKNAAFAVISGAISGVTPKVSGWIRVVNVDTIAFTMTTTSTANGVWTAEVATDYLGSNAIAVPAANISPAFPTGTSQNATPVITIPDRRYTHLRITFTPSAGSGNANADTGVVTSRGFKVERHTRGVGVGLYVPAADNMAGSFTMEYSTTHYDREDQGGVPQIDNLNDPQIWTAATDQTDAAYSIPAVAGTGQNLLLRLGLFEFQAIRFKFTPTSGFGRVRANLNFKG